MKPELEILPSWVEETDTNNDDGDDAKKKKNAVVEWDCCAFLGPLFLADPSGTSHTKETVVSDDSLSGEKELDAPPGKDDASCHRLSMEEVFAQEPTPLGEDHGSGHRLPLQEVWAIEPTCIKEEKRVKKKEQKQRREESKLRKLEKLERKLERMERRKRRQEERLEKEQQMNKEEEETEWKIVPIVESWLGLKQCEPTTLEKQEEKSPAPEIEELNNKQPAECKEEKAATDTPNATREWSLGGFVESWLGHNKDTLEQESITEPEQVSSTGSEADQDPFKDTKLEHSPDPATRETLEDMRTIEALERMERAKQILKLEKLEKRLAKMERRKRQEEEEAIKKALNEATERMERENQKIENEQAELEQKKTEKQQQEEVERQRSELEQKRKEEIQQEEERTESVIPEWKPRRNSKAVVLYSFVARDGTIVADSFAETIDAHQCEVLEELGKDFAEFSPKPGWFKTTFRRYSPKKLKGIKFNLDDINAEGDPVGWDFGCIYDPKSELERVQVRSFIEKIVGISEVFRQEEYDWQYGPYLAVQSTFGPILSQRMEEISYMGKRAMLSDTVGQVSTSVTYN